MADDIALKLVARYDGNQAEKGLSNLSKGVKQAGRDSKDLGKTVREVLTKEIATLGGISSQVSGNLIKSFGALKTPVIAATGAMIGFGLALKTLNDVENARRANAFKDQRFDTMFSPGSAARVSQVATAYSQSYREVEKQAIALAVATGNAEKSLANVSLIYRTSSQTGLDFAESRKAVAAAIKGERDEVEKLIPSLRGLKGETLDLLKALDNGGVNVGGGLGSALGNLFSAGRDRMLGGLGSTRSINNAELVLNYIAQQIRGGANDYQLGIGRQRSAYAGTGEPLSDYELNRLRDEFEERRQRERDVAAREAARRARARRDLIGDLSIDGTIGRVGGIRNAGQGFNPSELDNDRLRRNREEFRKGLEEDVAYIQSIAAGTESIFVNAFSAAVNGGNALKSILEDLRDNVIRSLGKALANALAPLIGSAFGGPLGGVISGAITSQGFSASPQNAGFSNARSAGLERRDIRG